MPKTPTKSAASPVLSLTKDEIAALKKCRAEALTIRRLRDKMSPHALEENRLAAAQAFRAAPTEDAFLLMQNATLEQFVLNHSSRTAGPIQTNIHAAAEGLLDRISAVVKTPIEKALAAARNDFETIAAADNDASKKTFGAELSGDSVGMTAARIPIAKLEKALAVLSGSHHTPMGVVVAMDLVAELSGSEEFAE